MDKHTTAIQTAFPVGDQVKVVGEAARDACGGADHGTVVGHCVPASDSDEAVEVIIVPGNGAMNNVKVAPDDLVRAD